MTQNVNVRMPDCLQRAILGFNFHGISRYSTSPPVPADSHNSSQQLDFARCSKAALFAVQQPEGNRAAVVASGFQ